MNTLGVVSGPCELEQSGEEVEPAQRAVVGPFSGCESRAHPAACLVVTPDDVVDLVAERCTESESGARNVDAILTRTLLPAVSAEILDRMASDSAFTRVQVKAENGDFAYAIE